LPEIGPFLGKQALFELLHVAEGVLLWKMIARYHSKVYWMAGYASRFLGALLIYEMFPFLSLILASRQ
jgi:hypothetical protein